MNNRLLTCTLLPLIAVIVAYAAYHGFNTFIAVERHLACTLVQATNTPYETISKLMQSSFLAAMLVVSIIQTCYCTFSCLRTTYKARQECNSKEQHDPVNQNSH